MFGKHKQVDNRLDETLSNNHLYYALPVQILDSQTKPVLIDTVTSLNLQYYTSWNLMGSSNQLLCVVVDVTNNRDQETLQRFQALINAIYSDDHVAIHGYNLGNAKAVQALLRQLYGGLWAVRKKGLPDLLQFEYLGQFQAQAPQLSQQQWLMYFLATDTFDATRGLSWLPRTGIRSVVANTMMTYLDNSATWSANNPANLVSIKVNWAMVMMYAKDFALVAEFLDQLPL